MKQCIAYLVALCCLLACADLEQLTGLTGLSGLSEGPSGGPNYAIPEMYGADYSAGYEHWMSVREELWAKEEAAYAAGEALGAALFVKGVAAVGKAIANAQAEYYASTTPEEREAHRSCIHKCDADHKTCNASCEGLSDVEQRFLERSPRTKCRWQCDSARDSCERSCYVR